AAPAGHRRRRRWRWARAGTGAAALLLAALGAARLWQERHRPVFSHLVVGAERAVTAIDADGNVLWRKRSGGYLIPATLRPGGPRRIVGFEFSAAARKPARPHTLSIFDAASGAPIDAVELVSARSRFAQLGFSDRYSIDLVAKDLDGDGADEIVISYTHAYQWPSYAVLYEPLRGRQRLVLMAPGHHRFAGAADLDGDGRLELLWAGINNRMGWLHGLAAVFLDPPLGAAGTASSPVSAVVPDELSPGRDGLHWGSLFWYAPLPPGACIERRCIRIDEGRRRILVGAGDGRLEVGFDGFRRDLPSELPASERRTRRRRLWSELYEAKRIARGGRPAAAAARAAAAAEEARAIDQPLIALWAGQLEATCKARAGELEEAEQRFEELLPDAPSAADVAFQAAGAFHLAGDLERAVAWYERALGALTSASKGRPRYEALYGLVMALGELGRWQRAAEAIGTFEAASQQKGFALHCRIYFDWRQRGAAYDGEELEDWPLAPDLARYWHLEWRRLRGVPAGELYRAARAELEETSEEVRALVRAFEAAPLLELGRAGEAVAAARAASDEIWAYAAYFPAARAHLGVVVERYARAARATGLEAEARAAEERYARWRAAQPARSP
ncbi:MAG: hypothetical protein D6696_17620, partial [Acidobacteria bacterium]